MIAVIDTNVFVSGCINPSGAPGRILDLVRAGALRLAVNDLILSEYRNVLRRPSLSPYFKISDIEHIIGYLQSGGTQVLTVIQITGLPNPHDAPFLEVALAGGSPLVTGNVKHFPQNLRHGVVVENPTAFLRRFE